MMTKPKLAETVFHRGAPEYKFFVDDAPFPWYMTERGPLFVRLLDDLWRVDMTLIAWRSQERSEYMGVSFSDDEFTRPMIAGLEFPWIITSEGITYHRSQSTLATVRLGFYAKEVDTDDSKVSDLRRRGKGGTPIYDLDGNIHGERLSHAALEADIRVVTKGEVLHP